MGKFSPWWPVWSPSLKPRPVLILTTWEDTEDTEDMEDTAWDTLVWDTEVCTEDTEDTDTDMASVRLRLSPRLMLRLVLIPTTLEDTEDMEDMAWDTLLWDTLVLDTLVSDTEVCMEDTEDTDMDMASVRLRLSPRLVLRLVLIPTTLEDTEDTQDTVWDTLLWDTLVSDTLVSDTEVCMEDTEDTDTDMASVRLRLSPR